MFFTMRVAVKSINVPGNIHISSGEGSKQNDPVLGMALLWAVSWTRWPLKASSDLNYVTNFYTWEMVGELTIGMSILICFCLETGQGRLNEYCKVVDSKHPASRMDWRLLLLHLPRGKTIRNTSHWIMEVSSFLEQQ